MSSHQNSSHQFSGATSAHLKRLLGFVESDPHNLNLLADAADAALDAQQFALCDELLDRHAAQQPLPPSLVNLRGLSAMSQRRFDEAEQCFISLQENSTEPAVVYNLAYANAMLGRFDEAAALLHETILASIPAAAALKVRALHHLRRVDEARELAQRYVDRPDADPELRGAYATLLFDAGDEEGAKRYAAMAPETADSLTVRGLLAIADGADAEAASMLERALQLRPESGRAKLGIGLCLVSNERFDEASRALDEAANLLKTHAGSWVAAGWAHLLNGALDTAKARYERAAELDRGFAEAPGGLAVVNFRQQRFDEARRYANVALRLDRSCLSAALALNLLAAHDGDQATADAILHAAVNRPIDSDGLTIAQALMRRASR
ncbi:tetratricopeptide repeat protein [Paraburkholderia sp. IW21]|uniref:tetratricopeptide repeat protein n=1 Tax=Paraburkholderia sp. IW21 TaxID=3242488 RepID=UPI003520770C